MPPVDVLKVDVSLQWKAEKIADSGRWIAECATIGLVVEADSLDELHAMVEEATDLLITDLVEDGELDAFLATKGWDAGARPTGLVPWALVAQGETHGSARRAS